MSLRIPKNRHVVGLREIGSERPEAQATGTYNDSPRIIENEELRRRTGAY